MDNEAMRRVGGRVRLRVFEPGEVVVLPPRVEEIVKRQVLISERVYEPTNQTTSLGPS